MQIIPKSETLNLEEIAKLWFTESEAAATDVVSAGYSTREEFSAFSRTIERNEYMQCLSLLFNEANSGRLKGSPVFGADGAVITTYDVHKENFIEWHNMQDIVLDDLSPQLAAWTQAKNKCGKNTYTPEPTPIDFEIAYPNKPDKQEWFLKEWIRMLKETGDISTLFDGENDGRLHGRKGIKREIIWNELHSFISAFYGESINNKKLFIGGGMERFFKLVGTRYIVLI